jgi:hypothetical protein
MTEAAPQSAPAREQTTPEPFADPISPRRNDQRGKERAVLAAIRQRPAARSADGASDKGTPG